MDFPNPFKIYWAESNVEAHTVVEALRANGIEAFADEDVSGASLWSLGRISQFHQPVVWVDESDAEQAARVVAEFDERKKSRVSGKSDAPDLEVTCEHCGTVSYFEASLDGTTQDCPKCGEFVDVGTWEWEEEDIGEDLGDAAS